MNSSGNRRRTLLPADPDAPESPYQRNRRIRLNISQQTESPNESLNDEDDERRTTRRFDLSGSENERTMEQAGNRADKSLNNCLQLVNASNINKDNVWSSQVIEKFTQLISKHHRFISNFQGVGAMLEASTKVYGLRVDSVYNDASRMSAGLAQKSAKALTKQGNRNAEDGEEIDREQDAPDENDPNVTHQEESQQQQQQQPKPKKTRKKRKVIKLTSNPESLNGRLDTIPRTDPFFAKLNSVIGDASSSSRLMQNIITTEESKLKLQKGMFWDSKDQPELDLNAKVDYKQQDPTRKMLNFKPNYRFGNISPLSLRTSLSNYRITNEPMGPRYEDNDTSFRPRFAEGPDNTVLHNSPHMELQFDINATVEPMPMDHSIVMDYGDMDQADREDVNEVDRAAMARCKGLRRTAVSIEDMEPETSVSLEYSYRPRNIDQYWAGPSHWKFMQSRRTGISVATRSSQRTAASISEQQTNKRNRRVIRKVEATLDDVRNVWKDRRNVLIETKTRRSNVRDWNRKMHKLPYDHKVPSDIFDKLIHAPSFRIYSNPDVPHDDNEAAPYDYNNENDRDYCNNHEELSDAETDMNNHLKVDVNNNSEVAMPPAPIDEIPDVFVGAPQRTEKISIDFARRAKVVDMKQLKNCIWGLLIDKHHLDPSRRPKFSEVFRELPKLLSPSMAENLSMPLAVYATRHLCNDKDLLLHQVGDSCEDFEVEFKDQLNVSASVGAMGAQL